MDLKHLEYIRIQSKQRFDKVKGTWIECGKWALPHRVRWMLSQTEGERNNQHIVDMTHKLALRSCVAGFLEGNTSASRPWYRVGIQDQDLAKRSDVKEWLDIFTKRTLSNLSSSNFYHAAGEFYFDYHVFNTGTYWIDETENGPHYTVLAPGSYYLMNNPLGLADVLVREYSMTVKQVVQQFGKKRNGSYDWSNFSDRVKNCYTDANYSHKVNICSITMQNKMFDYNSPIGGSNRQWVTISYEVGASSGHYDPQSTYGYTGDYAKSDIALDISYSARKPFIAGRSPSTENFEYGETGPTLDALGTIKSLNKKAISKDVALDQMIRPTVQGPASLRKSYVTTAPGGYVPLDAQAIASKGLQRVFEINPAIGALVQDVSDLRSMIDKIYYADFLLHLSRNPKTRTAAEVHAVVQEQQLIVGPNLQSLNFSHNDPHVDYIMQYTLAEDPYLPPIPEDLGDQWLRTEYISVFAQAQKAADLSGIERYLAFVQQVGQIDPSIFQKANLDKIADIYEDRLFLPAGINRDQQEVDAKREQAMMMQQRQQMLNETLPSVAGAVKDIGSLQKGE